MSGNDLVRKVSLGGHEFTVIDHTEPLREDLEVYPGDPVPQKMVFSDIVATEYQHHIYSIGDHHFHPHGDAPKHQNKDLQKMGFETFGLSQSFNSACLIDLSGQKDCFTSKGVTYLIDVKKEHLAPFHDVLSKVGAVVIRTGYDYWLEKNFPHTPSQIPFLSKDAAEYLASFKNIRVVGTDSITVDACGREKPVHTAHQLLRDRLIVESLVHLYLIPKEARMNFTLQTSPIRIVGATGGPILAYSYIHA